MKQFQKIVNGWKQLTIFRKKLPVLDIWKGSQNAFAFEFHSCDANLAVFVAWNILMRNQGIIVWSYFYAERIMNEQTAPVMSFFSWNLGLLF